MSEQIGGAIITWSGIASGGAEVAYSSNTVAEHAAECTTNCESYAPTFVTSQIGTANVAPTLGSSLIDLGAGGQAVAWTEHGNGGMHGAPLHYTECAANCSDGGTWVDLIIDSTDSNNAAPEMVLSANGVRALAFAGNGHSPDTQGVVYAECSSNCTSLAGWTEGTPEGSGSGGPGNLQFRPGLALYDEPDGGLLRMVSDGRSFMECAGTCTPGIALPSGWSAPADQLPQQGNGDMVMQIAPSGLPRLAVSNCSQVYVEDCTQAPCTSVSDWSSTQLTLNGQCNGEISFVLDAQGRGLVAYIGNASLTTGLSLASEQARPDGGLAWEEVGLTTCGGTAVGGDFPALALTPYGGIRIHYGASGGNAGHFMYMLGP